MRARSAGEQLFGRDCGLFFCIRLSFGWIVWFHSWEQKDLLKIGTKTKISRPFGSIQPGSSVTLMLLLSVRNIVRRSIPIPQPPVGGRPYSKAVQKFSSTI